MADFSDPNGFRLNEVVEWGNQSGPGARPNGMPCVILGPLDFYEGMNEAGEVDFGFGYEVRDVDGLWIGFSRELRKRLPPGPDWVTLCRLNEVGADCEVLLLVQIDVDVCHTLLEA